MNIDLQIFNSENFTKNEISSPYYFIIIIDGTTDFLIDFNQYSTNGKTLVFLSPYQLFQWKKVTFSDLKILKFHGDFYCIEYHKEEVACNGILFNSIYETPFVHVSDTIYGEIQWIVDKLKPLQNATFSYESTVTKTYLQLILALSSREKQLQNETNSTKITDSLNFYNLLENSFTNEKSVAFYADYYHLTVDVFSKKIKKNYGKTPSKLIQERLILEAKKQIHLTHKSIKEVASYLGFEDEFYFSRYFKKEVGVSPKIFREQVGISIAAKKSIE
ncbi:AraC family transcriptional regulator [Empedobacter sedimenti]|uniref:AraC family transcriptional regulator n=1 Tax=Empedobacter sedimenti TaxID=3042610 RepID=UPI00387EB5D5